MSIHIETSDFKELSPKDGKEVSFFRNREDYLEFKDKTETHLFSLKNEFESLLHNSKLTMTSSGCGYRFCLGELTVVRIEISEKEILGIFTAVDMRKLDLVCLSKLIEFITFYERILLATNFFNKALF